MAQSQNQPGGASEGARSAGEIDASSERSAMDRQFWNSIEWRDGYEFVAGDEPPFDDSEPMLDPRQPATREFAYEAQPYAEEYLYDPVGEEWEPTPEDQRYEADSPLADAEPYGRTESVTRAEDVALGDGESGSRAIAADAAATARARMGEEGAESGSPSQALEEETQPLQWAAAVLRRGSELAEEERRFAGEIESFGQASVADADGASQPQTLARVRLDNDELAVINLGGESGLADLSLEAGDRIEITGDIGRLAGREVLIAEEIHADGENVSLDQRVVQLENAGEQGASTAGESEGRQQRLEGEVSGFEQAAVEQSEVPGESRGVVRIRLQSGEAVLVDLGPRRSIEDLGLSEGDRVEIFGQTEEINGREVLSARRIRIGGEPVETSMNRSGAGDRDNY